MKIEIFIEGGGESKRLKTECRKGFSKFFEKAGLSGRMPKLVASGSRNNAYKDFCTALKNSDQSNTLPLLLVDSEASFSGISNQWAHLKNRDHWDQPPGANDEHVYLMVECMESWFLADQDCLKKYFGQGFNESSLLGNFQVETIPKADVFNSLKLATRTSKSKGEYGKGKHSFEILAKIDPNKVETVAPNVKRLLDFLKKPKIPKK